jgi:hypothetical protein
MKDLGRNMAVGGLAGAGLALAFLSIGLIRGLILLARGGSIAALDAKDVRLIVAYVAAFIVAGSFVGALRPFMTSKRGAYAVFAAAGIVVMNAIAIADRGLARMNSVVWIVMTVIGAIFGCAFARGLLGKPGEAPRVV